jgi:hypothetical protein
LISLPFQRLRATWPPLIPDACDKVSVRTNSGKCPILNSRPYGIRDTLDGEVGSDDIEQDRLGAIAILGEFDD